MTTEVRVPALGESVTEATVATWFKKPGDSVAVDEMLCELETDKVTVEVPSPAAGVLAVGIGVSVDTADKAAGGLRVHRCDAALGQIVRRARSLGLLTGLAGSLSVADIPFLAALGPDYLGFRGALCRGGRAGPLDPGAFQEVRAALDRAVARNAA